MARSSGGNFDRLNCVLDLSSKARGKPLRDARVLRLEFPDVLWQLRVKEGVHPRAARYSASVRPRTRPVAMSSIRRMPSATASLSGTGATTLSTNRRANSKRSSGGNSSARCDKSAELIAEHYLIARPTQVPIIRSGVPSSGVPDVEALAMHLHVIQC